MNFNHFIQERGKLIEKAQKGQAPGKLLEDPLTLAYLGDAWFSLYIRSYLRYQGWQNVRLLQSVEGKIASATYQAIAWRALEEEWTEEEKGWFKRGRNSSPSRGRGGPDYRISSGYEAVLGFLLDRKKMERLEEVAEKSIQIILKALEENKE